MASHRETTRNPWNKWWSGETAQISHLTTNSPSTKGYTFYSANPIHTLRQYISENHIRKYNYTVNLKSIQQDHNHKSAINVKKFDKQIYFRVQLNEYCKNLTSLGLLEVQRNHDLYLNRDWNHWRVFSLCNSLVK